jgi:hypothetical protein
MANGMLPAAEDVTPLLMMLPAADPSPPPTVTRQVPSHYRPVHPDGVPDLSPATTQMPGPNGKPPVHGGRHRGGQPPADAGGTAPSGTRSRRALILGSIVGFLVIATGGAAAAIALTHHHAPHRTAAPPARRAIPSQAPTTPSATASGPTPTPTPSSVAAGPAGWTYPKPIDQQAYKNNNAAINSVSCVTAVRCFAVDSAGDVLASRKMNSWQTVATDAPTGLTSISCASAEFCAAVDNSGSVVIYSGGTWSDPVSIDSGNQLTSVSCPTATFCMAVDNQGYAFTFIGTATQWSRITLDPNQDDIASVSCPNKDFCAAADQAGNVYTYDGASWSPADNIDSGNEFAQVSCYSLSFCAAVDNNGNAAVMTNGNWSVGSMPSTAAGVACPAAGYCVAVDTSGGALVYQQGGWSKASKVDGNNAFATISCVGVDTCAAADQYDNVMYYAASS